MRPDEGETISQLNETFDRILKRTAEGSGQAARSVHAKSHGILEGTLTIDPGLPSTKLGSLGGTPNSDPLGETYHSLAPFLYGDHIAKFEVRPLSENLKVLSGELLHPDSEHLDAIRETVRAEMARLDGEWEFRVQLCRDLDRQPAEDRTVEWKENEAPFQRVGVIRVHAQDSWSDEQVRTVDEGMRFSVWTGLTATRPLGNINRARNAPYRRSAGFRQQFNRCPIYEPAAD